MNNNKIDLSDEAVKPELYFLIAHFLNNSQFDDVAKALIEKLEQNNALPKRIDWTGKEHPRTYHELVDQYKHIPGNFLLQAQNQLRLSLDKLLQNKFSNVNTLLGSGKFSLLQNLNQPEKKQTKNVTNLDAIPKDIYVNYHSSHKYSHNLSRNSLNGGNNLLLNLNKRQLNYKLDTANIIQPELFRSVNSHIRILGHLSAVYCVCFDRTGRYILTGADDHLIKIWCAYDGRLMATFRGHQKEISDIDINYENTLIASGSCDKTIRIWNLKTTESTTILQGHTAMVTSVEFSPLCRGEERWLASSGNDGIVCFWQWNSKTLSFNPKPKKFNEKTRPGGQILCLSFSSGGSFMAAGSNDHAIRVYFFDNGSPIKICELESHTNIVDSIQYASNSARFLSGSKDGTARIWHYESQKWHALLLDGSKTLQKQDYDELSLMDIHKKYSVTMVTWNSDDSLVATAQSNFLIKIWNSVSGDLVHELKYHTAEIFVLEAHPRDPRLLLSAGHDGNVILWNILTGKMIKRFYNRIENEGHGCLFDAKWSPNLDMFASTDSHGYLSMFGFGNGERYSRVPREQFFHSDYRPLMHDMNGFAIDEQTQTAPHLMPPPFLVNADGNPYNAEYQRLVPGRENLNDAQLTPHTIMNDNGVAEIIGDREQEDDENNEQNRQQQSNRYRSMWVKDLIRPLDLVTLQTNEINRITKLDIEEDYFVTEYKKELAANELLNKNGTGGSRDLDHHCSSSNHAGTGGGTRHELIKKVVITTSNTNTNRNRNYNENSNGPSLRNNNRRDLYDSENEDNSRPVVVDYDDENTYDQYIDVDDDSNTQMSNNNNNNNNVNNQSSSITTTTATNSARNNRNNNVIATASTNYIDPLDLASDMSDSSEYSDWAEEDGRRTLKPPPRRQTTSTRQQQRANRRSRRQLRVLDDDEANNTTIEDESLRTRKSKRKPRRVLTSDEDETEKMDEDCEVSQEESQDDEEGDYSSEEDEDEDYINDENIDPNKPCTSSSARINNNSNIKIPKKRGRKSKAEKKALEKSLSNSRYATKASKLNDLSISSISKSSKKTSKTAKLSNKQVNVKECPVEYRPPEWLTSTKPRKSPYFPQIGDEVVYFRQGHELYINAVKQNKIYDLDEKSIPWLLNKNCKINVQEFCKVMGVKIEIKPPRLVCLKLAVLDGKTNKTGHTFNIKYHDMEHVVDFVILRQYYERGLEKKWKEKDRFRCIIDDVWWFGMIESKIPLQDDHPDCQFQCLKVLWDNGQCEEGFSPWDLEPLCGGAHTRKAKPMLSSSASASNIAGEGMAVTPEDIKSLLYVPETGEWPDDDRESECERILKGLEKIMELSLAEFFNYPVDLDSFPAYSMVISYPIDLNTIKERLENRFYRRINAIQWDVRKIAKNAVDFNEPNTPIVKKANLLTELILEFINEPHCTNPMPIYKRLCKNKNVTLMGDEEGLGLDDNDEEAVVNSKKSNDLYDDGEEEDEELENDYAKGKSSRGKSSSKSSKDPILPKNNRTNKPSKSGSNRIDQTDDINDKNKWKNMCKELLNDLLRHSDSVPFREAVDLNEYPDYVSIIEQPIDLSLIKDRLYSNEYDSDLLNKFDKDCKLLFANSKSYNTSKRSKIYGMTLRLQALYDSRIKQIIDSYKRAKSSSSISQSASTNGETSKYGRMRKFRYHDVNELYGNASMLDETIVKVKSTKQKLKNDINTSEAVRSNRRSTRHSTANYYNENSQHSQQMHIEENNVNDDDNIEYNLTNILNYNNKNEDITNYIQPCTSRSNLAKTSNSNNKNGHRIHRADSDTNFSYDDAINNNSNLIEYFDDNANHANNNNTAKKSKKNDETEKNEEKYNIDQEENKNVQEEEEELINKEKANKFNSNHKKRGRKKKKKNETSDGTDEDNEDEEEENEEEEYNMSREENNSDDTEFDADDDYNDEDYRQYSVKKSHKNKSNRLNSHNSNSNHENFHSNNKSKSSVKNKSNLISRNSLLDNKENDSYQNYNNSASGKIKSNDNSKKLNKNSNALDSSGGGGTRSSKRLRKKFDYKEDTSSSNEDEKEDDDDDENENETSKNNHGKYYDDHDNSSDEDFDDENSNQRTRLSRGSRKRFKVK